MPSPAPFYPPSRSSSFARRHNGTTSPQDSIGPESSRASQLSDHTEYSFDELTRRVFYKPEGEDESARARPQTVELDQTITSRFQSIDQTLQSPPPPPLAQPTPRYPSSDFPPSSTNRYTLEASTWTSPGRSSFMPSTLDHDTDPPTPMTTPTQHTHELGDPGPSSSVSRHARAHSRSNHEPQPNYLEEQGTEHEIPHPAQYPRIKLSPPPKRKSDSNKSSPHSPSASVALSAVPPSADSQRRHSAPAIPSPVFSPPTVSRRVRFLSAIRFDSVRPLVSPRSPPDPSSMPPSQSPIPILKRPQTPSIERTMFIIGFLFPWCWLIGGWLLPPSNPSPLCAPSVEKLRANSSKVQRSSSDNLLPTHYNTVYSGNQRSYMLTVSPNRTPTPARSRMRWGRRCRIAASVGLSVVLVIVGIAIWAAVAR